VKAAISRLIGIVAGEGVHVFDFDDREKRSEPVVKKLWNKIAIVVKKGRRAAGRVTHQIPDETVAVPGNLVSINLSMVCNALRGRRKL
jgi:hypothetical protein